jgi:DNA-binding XRE family transcriptional regulator
VWRCYSVRRQRDAVIAERVKVLINRVPEYQAESDRTRLAHDVAKRVAAYRAKHKLTQNELARILGMRQPHVARLEAGEYEPSLATMSRLARVLNMEFHIVITRSVLLLTS